MYRELAGMAIAIYIFITYMTKSARTTNSSIAQFNLELQESTKRKRATEQGTCRIIWLQHCLHIYHI